MKEPSVAERFLPQVPSLKYFGNKTVRFFATEQVESDKSFSNNSSFWSQIDLGRRA